MSIKNNRREERRWQNLTIQHGKGVEGGRVCGWTEEKEGRERERDLEIKGNVGKGKWQIRRIGWIKGEKGSGAEWEGNPEETK